MTPLKTHLVRKGYADGDQAEDLVQGFIADKVIERDLVTSADRNRGKFRTFLVTCLERYVTSEYRKQNAQKRTPAAGIADGDGWLDAHVCSDEGSYTSFDIAWAKQVIHQALAEMKDACVAREDSAVWNVFEARVVRVAMHGLEPVPYARLIETEVFESYSQATKALFHAKQLYIHHLRSVVGCYVSGPEDIDREIGELQDILAAAVRKA